MARTTCLKPNSPESDQASRVLQTLRHKGPCWTLVPCPSSTRVLVSRRTVEDKKIVSRKHCQDPCRRRLPWKYQRDGQRLNKVLVCSHWELCPAHMSTHAVNTLTSSPPGLLSKRSIRGRTGKSCPLQAWFPGAKAPAWLWGSHSSQKTVTSPKSSGMPRMAVHGPTRPHDPG